MNMQTPQEATLVLELFRIIWEFKPPETEKRNN